MTYVTVWDGTPKTSRLLFVAEHPTRVGVVTERHHQLVTRNEIKWKAWHLFAQPRTLTEICRLLQVEPYEVTVAFQALRRKLVIVGQKLRREDHHGDMVNVYQQAALAETVAASVGA